MPLILGKYVAGTQYVAMGIKLLSFAVVCLVAWPLNEKEAEGDLVLIEN